MPGGDAYAACLAVLYNPKSGSRTGAVGAVAAVLFATGIGIYFALPQEPSMWLTLAVIELTLLAVWLARHQQKLLWLLAGWGVMLAGLPIFSLKQIYLSERLRSKTRINFICKGVSSLQTPIIAAISVWFWKI